MIVEIEQLTEKDFLQKISFQKAINRFIINFMFQYGIIEPALMY